jgi:uncharacterized protein (DUF1501 family)
MSDARTPTTRRDFLRQGGLLALAGASPFGLSLFAAGAASAQSSADFKALVCVFLAGGNDQSNTLVPLESSAYAAYQRARPTLALPGSSLLPLSAPGYSGPALGLHPSLGALRPLFERNRVAMLANVGALNVPTTRTTWNNGRPTVPVPYQLFSHSDQQNGWQTGLPDRPSQTGWLGRVSDLLERAYNPTSGVSMSLSVGGNNTVQVGARSIQYQLTTQGPVRVNALSGLYGSSVNASALRRMLTQGGSELFGRQLDHIGTRALDNEVFVANALSTATMSTAFPDTSLGRQLRMVARMIAARGALGQRRQIYFVQQGGYDFHDDLVADHATRLQELGDALAAFHRSTEDLGVAASVTSFTASEFGRALQSNGRGSDHGWGGHQFILGGAVAGGRLYGQWPDVALGGREDAGQGRLVPTTSVDEFAATLVRWFGVPISDLATVIPNIGRFASRDLGFMGPLPA